MQKDTTSFIMNTGNLTTGPVLFSAHSWGVLVLHFGPKALPRAQSRVHPEPGGTAYADHRS